MCPWDLDGTYDACLPSWHDAIDERAEPPGSPAEQPMPDAPDQHSETRRRPVLAVLSLALVTFALSESVFWGQWGQAYGQGPLAALATYTVYLIVVVAVLGVLQRTGAGGRRGLVLGGALLGWLVEGVVVQTTYEALPLSVSFTGLAWHALITVVVGWWGAQVVLTRSLGQALGAAAAAGVAWGLWAAFMAGDLEAGLTADTLDAFAAYVLVTVASLVLGLHGWQTWRGAALVGRWPVRGAFAVLGLAAVATTVVVPLAPVVLAPLLGATWWALRRSPGVPAQLDGTGRPVAPAGGCGRPDGDRLHRDVRRGRLRRRSGRTAVGLHGVRRDHRGRVRGVGGGPA